MNAILNRLSIRTRITVGSFLLAALFFAGAALLVHRQVEGILNSATAEILESDAAPFTAATVDLATETAEPPGEDQLVAVIDPDGVVALSTLPAALERQLAALAAAGPGAHDASTSGANYRVLVTTAATDAGDWTVVTARNDKPNQVILDRLTAGLAWGLVALTLVFTAASWLLTGAALRPITRLRRGADALVVERSDALLPVGEARDEVNALGATLNRLIADLRASADRERQMVSDVSHELRTPLAILQAQLELLRPAVSAPLDADVAAAEAATARLTRIVANLLELSRLDAHVGAGSATIDELGMEIADVVDRARFSVANADITIDFAVPDVGTDYGTLVGMNATTFGRVADNLVDNAIAALAGSGTIQIDLDGDADGVELAVSDTGPGMPADFIPRAFDRFSRADPARSPQRGTGLGLAIVSAAVADADGSIELDSSSDGLRVVVRLPAVHPARVEPEAERRPEH